MTAMLPKDEIKRMIAWVQERVSLARGTEVIVISFDEPKAEDFLDAGFDNDAVRLTLGGDWWDEMAADIVETPEYAEPDESPERVLAYARDTVSEYFRKRLGT